MIKCRICNFVYDANEKEAHLQFLERGNKLKMCKVCALNFNESGYRNHFFRDHCLSNQMKNQVVKSENHSSPNCYEANQMLFLLITGNVNSKNKKITKPSLDLIFFHNKVDKRQNELVHGLAMTLLPFGKIFCWVGDPRHLREQFFCERVHLFDGHSFLERAVLCTDFNLIIREIYTE